MHTAMQQGQLERAHRAKELRQFAQRQIQREQKDKVDQAKVNIEAGCDRLNYFDLNTALPEDRENLEGYVELLIEQGYAKRNDFDPNLVRIYTTRQEHLLCA